jgi:hypothetical protein
MKSPVFDGELERRNTFAVSMEPTPEIAAPWNRGVPNALAEWRYAASHLLVAELSRNGLGNVTSNAKSLINLSYTNDD